MNSKEKEKPWWKWWVEKVIIPLIIALIGSGGLVAIFFAIFFAMSPRRLPPPKDLSTDVKTQEPVANSISWLNAPVHGQENSKTVIWKADWRDISWISENEGWLCGAVREGGGSGDVGVGLLLHTVDGGNSWSEVGNIPAGQGSFTWGPSGTRLYTWSDVGPINSIYFMKRFLERNTFRIEGVLATATGIYHTSNSGESWKRLTPGPDHGERYAFFTRLAFVEYLDEIYTAGWQGIAHWPGPDGAWEVQKPTYFYDIRSISVIGGSENRSVWAVGREGIDTQGNSGDRSHGAIYHLSWPSDRWEKVPLPDIEFESGQAFSDILLLDYETVIVVGDRGIIVRGSRDNKLGWEWTKSPKQTDEALTSIAYHDKTLWIVGSGGVVLKSTDKGVHWKKEPVIKNKKSIPVNLRRIRFFNNRGWILGNDSVLRSGTALER